MKNLSFDQLLARFDYEFPEELIAQAPAKPRDAAKLLVYDRESEGIQHSTFRHLADFLPKGSVLVLNETKVIPARLPLVRSTGGIVPILVLGQAGKGIIRALAPKALKEGEVLHLPHASASFTVIKRDDNAWLLKINLDQKHFTSLLDRKGSMPLPPYIKHTPLTPKQQREQYQSVFAKIPGSIAAPTASLHFTERLFRDLKKRGIKIEKITLHVHLGTFAPLNEEQWKNKRLHEEHFEISKKTASALNKAKKEGQKIYSVGTTVTRALEASRDASGKIRAMKSSTDLFLYEGHGPKCIDGMITNFHVPRSSLMMLVASLTGRDQLMEIYQEAIDERYRLFSFGDGMLILS